MDRVKEPEEQVFTPLFLFLLPCHDIRGKRRMGKIKQAEKINRPCLPPLLLIPRDPV